MTRLQLEKEMGVQTLDIRSDSQLVIDQIWGDYEVKELLLIKYVQVTKGLLEEFNYDI